MKRATWSIVMLGSLVVVLSVVTAFTAVSSANAQLGNTAVPVRCEVTLLPNTGTALSCTAADGTPFTPGSTVPAAHYLLVTDVMAIPSALGASASFYAWWLEQDRDGKIVEDMQFSSQTRQTFAEHFSSPVLVLSPGDYLWATNSASSAGELVIRVFGLLTTNYNYLPMIAR